MFSFIVNNFHKRRRVTGHQLQILQEDSKMESLYIVTCQVSINDYRFVSWNAAIIKGSITHFVFNLQDNFP